MVPSWTETLVECGANVVGRTRFCIHPSDKIKKVSVVGGTKNIDLLLTRELKPDLLILDQEENPKQMADESPCETYASHIQNVSDVPKALKQMSELFLREGEIEVAENLKNLKLRWEKVISLKQNLPPQLHEIPGIKEWIREPVCPSQNASANDVSIVYMIWREPWMCVAPGTFIASVFELLGFPVERIWPGQRATSTAEKYRTLHLDELPGNAVLLFSSEPFPFHRKVSELQALPFSSAVVDGEAYSWFGIRTLVFLEQALQPRS